MNARSVSLLVISSLFVLNHEQKGVAQDFKFPPTGPTIRDVLNMPVKLEAFAVGRPRAGQPLKESNIRPQGIKFEIQETLTPDDKELAANLGKFVLDPKTRSPSGASGFGAETDFRISDKAGRKVIILIDLDGMQFSIHAEGQEGDVESNLWGFFDEKLLPTAKSLVKRARKKKSAKEKSE